MIIVAGGLSICGVCGQSVYIALGTRQISGYYLVDYRHSFLQSFDRRQYMLWWKICIAQNMGWEEAGCKYLFTLQQGLWQSYSCSDWCGYTTLQHRNTAVDKQQGLIFVQHTTAASPISYTPQWTESDRILSLDFETEKKQKQMNWSLTNFRN